MNENHIQELHQAICNLTYWTKQSAIAERRNVDCGEHGRLQEAETDLLEVLYRAFGVQQP